MPSLHLPWTGVFLSILGLVTYQLYVKLFTSTRLAPGPSGLPIIGNTFQVPSQHLATYLQGLHSRFGGLVYLSVNRQHIFSIGDLELATELLERRSAIYSSRPANTFLERYADPQGSIFSFTPLGESHYWGRKIGMNIMKCVKAGHTEPLQRMETVALLRGVLDDGGKNWYEQIDRTLVVGGRMSASLTVAVMFGVSSMTGESPEIAKVLELVNNLEEIVTPSITIINSFPFLDDIIPKSITTPWRKFAKHWHTHGIEGWNQLSWIALEGKGAQMSTWASMFAEQEKDRKQLLNIFSAAAIDTTAAAMHAFILACVAFPEWIESAQEELDRVVGKDRLPDFRDRASLPFIEAVVREVLRWTPPVRIGIPHLNTADDVVKYRGEEYFIPKGSIIYCPPHVMEHDATRYESPEAFRPQRFLDEKGQLKADYRTTTFGFGRRLCVGVPFAERTLWIVVATMLWTFNIRRFVDPETGLPFEYDTSDRAFQGGISTRPLSVPVTFEPRDEGRANAVRKEWEDGEKDLSVLLPPLKRWASET